MINHLFVYGTLKEGRPLDRLEFKQIRTRVRQATILGKIYNLGWFPGVKLSGDKQVFGEVHTFPQDKMKEVLEQMDRIEGYREDRPEDQNMYNRRIVKAATEAGEEVDAYVYEFARVPPDDGFLPEGVWEPKVEK